MAELAWRDGHVVMGEVSVKEVATARYDVVGTCGTCKSKVTAHSLYAKNELGALTLALSLHPMPPAPMPRFVPQHSK